MLIEEGCLIVKQALQLTKQVCWVTIAQLVYGKERLELLALGWYRAVQNGTLKGIIRVGSR